VPAGSERTGTRREAGLPELSRAALALTLGLGIVAGAILAAVAEPLCESALNLSPELRAEGASALRILALSLPLVTVTAALRGLLEAGHRFDWVNAIRAPLGIFTFAALWRRRYGVQDWLRWWWLWWQCASRLSLRTGLPAPGSVHFFSASAGSSTGHPGDAELWRMAHGFECRRTPDGLC